MSNNRSSRIAPLPGPKYVIPAKRQLDFKQNISPDRDFQRNLEKSQNKLDSILETESKNNFTDIRIIKFHIQSVLNFLQHGECGAESLASIVNQLGQHRNMLFKLNLIDEVRELLINSGLFDVIRQRLLARNYDCNVKQFTDIFYILVSLGFKWNDFHQKGISHNFLSAISNIKEKLNVDDCVTLFWIFARLNISDDEINIRDEERFEEIGSQLLNKIKYLIHNSNSKELAEQIPTLLWSLAKLDYRPSFLREQGILDNLLNILLTNASNYDIKQLNKSFHALSLFKFTVYTLDEKLIFEILKNIAEKKLNTRSVVSITQALADIGINSDYLDQHHLSFFMEKLQINILKLIDTFSFNQCANLLWALAILSGTNLTISTNLVALKLWQSLPANRLPPLATLHEISEACDFFDFPILENIANALQNRPQPNSSDFHKEVTAVLYPFLKKYGITEIQEEKRESALFLDSVVLINNRKLDIEFNESLHYDETGNLFPRYQFRKYLLEKKGYIVVDIPSTTWNEAVDKESYLKKLFEPYLPKLATTKTSAESVSPFLPFTMWHSSFRSRSKNKDDTLDCSLTMNEIPRCNIL